MEARLSRNRLAELIGPFYTAAGVATWLNLREMDIQVRVRRRQLLGCVTADGQLLLPVAQFGEDGRAPTGMQKVLDVLATGIDDPWTWGLWLFSRVPDQLEGMSAMEWLKDKRELNALLAMARNDANSWSA